MNEGGGASRSTDPASGTSAATDVSLREHLNTKIADLDRHLTHEIAALRRETQQANANAERAINVAAEEAKERLAAHNGLIQKMEDQATHFATRESVEDFKETHATSREAVDGRFSRVEKFQYMLTGAIFLLSFIGFTNLIKVWSG